MSILKRIWHKIRGSKPLTIYEESDLLIEAMRKKGAIIGNNVTILDSKIDVGNLYLLEIVDDVTITGARVLTHDACMLKKTGYFKLGKVKIGSNVFVSVDSIILPGTTIGNNVIIGAGCVVAKDVPDNSVVVGNPMKKIYSYDEFLEKHKTLLSEMPVSDFENMNKDTVLHKNIKEKGIGYIKR